MKEAVKYLGGIGLAVFLLWLVFRGIDRRTLAAALMRASWSGLALGATINLAHNVFRVWRWRALLDPIRPRLHFRPMWVAIILGYMTTWIIPGRLGELVRPALLSAREDVPIGPCVGSVVADRVLDGAAILVLFALGTFLSPLQGPAADKIRTAAIVMLGLIVAFMIAIVIVSSVRTRAEAWVEKRHGLVRWAGRAFLALTRGTEALRQPRLLGIVMGWSLLAWLTIALGTWIGVLAAGARIPFVAVLVMLPILAFGVAVPTPSGAGGYHAAMRYGLETLFGVPADEAVAAGILMHVGIVVPVIVLGLVHLKAEKISWRDMLRAARQVGTLGADSSGLARGGGSKGETP